MLLPSLGVVTIVLCRLIRCQILAIIMAKVERNRMSTLTMGLAEAKNNFSRVTAEVNRTGKPVTILKNNRPWVVIQPAQQSESAVDVAVDFMDAYADVFEELAK